MKQGTWHAPCPYCRTPRTTSVDENNERMNKRVEAGDADATDMLAHSYYHGEWGLAKDPQKAFELWLRAAELGSAHAHCCIAYMYNNGVHVEIDRKKAEYHYQQAVMGGDATARHNLGVFERLKGNFDRAIKHWMIAAAFGFEVSLTSMREAFMNGHATKAQYVRALRDYQTYVHETKNQQRDRAAGRL